MWEDFGVMALNAASLLGARLIHVATLQILPIAHTPHRHLSLAMIDNVVSISPTEPSTTPLLPFIFCLFVQSRAVQ